MMLLPVDASRQLAPRCDETSLKLFTLQSPAIEAQRSPEFNFRLSLPRVKSSVLPSSEQQAHVIRSVGKKATMKLTPQNQRESNMGGFGVYDRSTIRNPKSV